MVKPTCSTEQGGGTHGTSLALVTAEFFLLFFKILFLFYFLERGEEGEKKRKRNINVWLPLTGPPTGDFAHKCALTGN